MPGKNIILKDKQGNQVFPATTAEQVHYSDGMNLKQAIQQLDQNGVVLNEEELTTMLEEVLG